MDSLNVKYDERDEERARNKRIDRCTFGEGGVLKRRPREDCVLQFGLCDTLYLLPMNESILNQEQLYLVIVKNTIY